MNVKSVWMVAALGCSALAFAADENRTPSSSPSMGAQSTSPPSANTQRTEGKVKQIEGPIVSVSESMLMIEDKNGEVVPVMVTETTMLEGKQAKSGSALSAQLRDQYKEGTQVRTSYMEQEQAGRKQNVATKIEKKR